MDIYQNNKVGCDYEKLSDTVCVSKFRTLSLQEYCTARNAYCSHYHKQNCVECSCMIKAAEIVIQGGVCLLASVFRSAFPGVTYHASNAKRRLLQMPMAAIRIQEPSTGKAEVHIMELVYEVDYIKIEHFLNACASKKSTPTPSLSKPELKQLLLLAQSDRERELVRFTAFRASGLTATGARKQYGFQDLSQRTAKIEGCIRETECIRECIDRLAKVQESSVLRSVGIVPSDDSSESSSESDSEEDGGNEEPSFDTATTTMVLPNEELTLILQQSKFNWFELVDRVTEKSCKESELVVNELEKFFPVVMASGFSSSSEKALIEQSHQAFSCDCSRERLADRQARALNHLIVTDSESDDPDQYLDLHDLASTKAQALISKKRKALRRRARYLKAKHIAERNFLSRKVTHRVRGILKECPNIGKDIEKFVEEANCGADAWRRTGVLTSDGNTRVKSKVTYERIRQHLMKLYNRNFAFGTVVQLCVARNRRRQSAKRYKGVAQVTSRRARKGFMLKYNPDAHWSGAFYRGLNLFQYEDGRHILNVNRDDASGYRLDTMATHRLHRTPMVKGSEATTTYTDYVNKYKAILQTTSYNFSGTKTTAELCAGVVKPTGIFPKNPTQHSSDLEMLEHAPEIKPAFFNPETNERKLIECIRVDGATDEGPSHDEVQFLWSARHLSKCTIATLVTARNSGSSYLNRVELQNGCLSLAHANMFIPSTLGGSCMDSGTVNKEKYERNMNLATDVYISRVNGCPCGDSVIHLYRGADSSEQQKTRKFLLQYLKGSKQQIAALKKDQPTLYAYFEQVWKLRKRHMVNDLPPQYTFFLVCCLRPDCSHPVCKSEQLRELPKWFPGGPSVSCLPLPIPDPQRYWGNPNCKECTGHCCGHFLKPTEAVVSTLPPMKKPPSIVLKEAFDSLKSYPPSDSHCEQLSRAVLLPVEEIKIWLDHLHTIQENRRRGAAKAAETRRQKKAQRDVEKISPVRESEYYCGVCRTVFQELTDTEEQWIGCDTWFHFTCLGIAVIPDEFYCEDCQ